MKYIRVKVKYLAPYIKNLMGLEEETITIEGEASLKDLMVKIAEIHGKHVLTQLLNESGDRLRESLLTLINNTVIQDINHKLKDGDTITLLIAIDGG